MPPQLKKGQGTIRANVKQLMEPPRSQSRKKAIITIAKKHNITREEAQFHQAISIAKSQAKKK